jgi:hypothetical protein
LSRLREKLRLLRATPRLVRDFTLLARALKREDWPGVLSILDGMSGFEFLQLAVMRGYALAKMGRHAEAVVEFESVDRHKLGRLDEEAYFTQFAHVLGKVGRADDAIALLREAPIGRFPESQRRWVVEFLKGNASWQDRSPRELPSLDPPWTHWWIEGDGFCLEVVSAEEPLRALAVVEENRKRMGRMVAYRARFDDTAGRFIHQENSYVISAWSRWTGKADR